MKVKLPTDEEAFDSVVALRKEIKDKNQDENFVDINSFLIGVNWCKDYITKNLKK